MTAAEAMTAVLDQSDASTRSFMDSVTKEARAITADTPEPTGEERMPVVMPEEVMDTANETWAMSDTAWYKTASDFAASKLINGKGKWCLVIGSPIPELRKLEANGWDCVYTDCRQPPADVQRWFQADATALPSGGAFYDAVSSTCVVCHAGLGRYGDPVKPNGDVAVMREIFRVLKPGGLAVVCFGPCSPQMRRSAIYGNVHRIYKIDDAIDMAEDVGFEMVSTQLATKGQEPVGAPEIEEAIGEQVIVKYCYLSALLRKPE